MGVSFDDPAKNAHFAEKNDFNYPLLSDLDRSMGLAYGAADAADQSAARRVGVILTPDGRIHAWHARVSAREFPQQALAAIPAL